MEENDCGCEHDDADGGDEVKAIQERLCYFAFKLKAPGYHDDLENDDGDTGKDGGDDNRPKPGEPGEGGG